MGKEISFYDYIASNNPQGVEKVVSKFGEYPQTRSKYELSLFLKDIVRKNGETALKSIAEIHPDKELIESVSIKTESFANACGCQSFTTFDGTEYRDNSKCGVHKGFTNADGDSKVEETTESESNQGISQGTLNTMLMGSILVLVLASAIKKM